MADAPAPRESDEAEADSASEDQETAPDVEEVASAHAESSDEDESPKAKVSAGVDENSRQSNQLRIQRNCSAERFPEEMGEGHGRGADRGPFSLG